MAFRLNVITSLFYRPGSNGDRTGPSEGPQKNHMAVTGERKTSNCAESSALATPATVPQDTEVESFAGGVANVDGQLRSKVQGGLDGARIVDVEGGLAEVDEAEHLNARQDHCRGQGHTGNEADHLTSSSWAAKWVPSWWRARPGAHADEPVTPDESANTLDKSDISSLSGSTLVTVDDIASWSEENDAHSYHRPNPDCPVIREETKDCEDDHLCDECFDCQADEAVIQGDLVHAQGALRRGRCMEGLHRAMNALSEAKEVGLELLEAKCYFWKAIAEYNLGEYHAAYDSLARAEDCRGLYLEGDWLDEYMRKVEQELAHSRKVLSGF